MTYPRFQNCLEGMNAAGEDYTEHPMHTWEELQGWIDARNKNLQVTLKKIPLSQCAPLF